MSPQQEQIVESIIRAALPELRDGLHSLLNGAPIHIVSVQVGINQQTGLESNILLFLAQELPGKVLQGTAEGIQASNQRAVEIMQHVQQQQNGQQRNRIILPGSN